MCTRTCWALVVHLGAFKSQLVATIAHIYVYIYIYVYTIYIYVYIYVYICIYMYIPLNYLDVLGFSSQRITLMIHFLSSVTSMGAPTWCHGAI